MLHKVTMPSQEMPPAIAEALVAVMGAIGQIAKSETNEHGKYRYATIDDFMMALSPCLSTAGLIIKPVCTGSERFDVPGKSGTRHMCRYMYKFRFIHKSGAMWCDPEDVRAIEVDASGAQASGAAESYAWKQYCRALFAIPTGDEDADAQAHLDVETRKAKVQAAKAANATGERQIVLDVGQGMQPIPVADLERIVGSHLDTLEANGVMAWIKRNVEGRAAIHARYPDVSLRLKKRLEHKLRPQDGVAE